MWGARPPAAASACVCLICGHLPDFDRSVAKRLGVRRRDHHRWVSHSLVGWLGPTLLVLAAARGGRHAALARRGAISLWLHLALDTYYDGLAWLWPVSEEKLGFFRRPASITDRGWRTPAPLDTEPGRVEAVMWAIAALRAARAG